MNKSSLMHVKELRRLLTNENAGVIAVHVEYLARTSNEFGDWRGTCNVAQFIAYTPLAQRRSRLDDTLWIMEIEIKRRQGVSNYHVRRRIERST